MYGVRSGVELEVIGMSGGQSIFISSQNQDGLVAAAEEMIRQA